jgi:hypothetical protein
MFIVHVYNVYTAKTGGPGERSRCSDSLRAGRSGDRIPVEARFPHPSTPALESAQTPVQGVPGPFPRVNPPGRDVPTHPHLAPRLR